MSSREGGDEVSHYWFVSLYLLTNGSLLVYTCQGGRNPTRGGQGHQIADDSLVDRCIGWGKIEQLRQGVSHLYETAGLPALDMPQDYSISPDDLKKVRQSLNV